MLYMSEVFEAKIGILLGMMKWCLSERDHAWSSMRRPSDSRLDVGK